MTAAKSPRGQSVEWSLIRNMQYSFINSFIVNISATKTLITITWLFQCQWSYQKPKLQSLDKIKQSTTKTLAYFRWCTLTFDKIQACLTGGFLSQRDSNVESFPCHDIIMKLSYGMGHGGCLMAPSHYLNQCWLIISEDWCHSFQGNFIWNTHGIWVRSRNCGCLVTWFCYQLIAKPGDKTAAVPWPDPLYILDIS